MCLDSGRKPDNSETLWRIQPSHRKAPDRPVDPKTSPSISLQLQGAIADNTAASMPAGKTLRKDNRTMCGYLNKRAR